MRCARCSAGGNRSTARRGADGDDGRRHFLPGGVRPRLDRLPRLLDARAQPGTSSILPEPRQPRARADRAPLPAQEAHIEVPSITKAIVEVMRSEIKTPDEQLEEVEELVLRAVDYGRRSA